MKFFPFWQAVIGILILKFNVWDSSKCINLSVYPLTTEYDESKKLGLDSSVNPLIS